MKEGNMQIATAQLRQFDHGDIFCLATANLRTLQRVFVILHFTVKRTPNFDKRFTAYLKKTCSHHTLFPSHPRYVALRKRQL